MNEILERNNQRNNTNPLVDTQISENTRCDATLDDTVVIESHRCAPHKVEAGA